MLAWYMSLFNLEIVFFLSQVTLSVTFVLNLSSACHLTFVKVELIGYAASNDDLFLVYEYAQKGSLKNHLHEPQNKGKISLLHTTYMQITIRIATWTKQ